MADATPVPAAAALEEIRGLIAARDDLAARMNWDDPAAVSAFNAAQDKLAARVPVLLAAAEAVLEKAAGWETQAGRLYGLDDAASRTFDDCAEVVREAITSALAGTARENVSSSTAATREDGEP